MSRPNFDSHLTPLDERNFKAFRTLLTLDKLTEFSSDDFRRYGLDRFIADKAHGIGVFFGKLKANGLVERVGYVRSELASNHGREIKTYQLTPKGKTWHVTVKQETLAVEASP